MKISFDLYNGANETDCVSGGALTLGPWKTVALLFVDL